MSKEHQIKNDIRKDISEIESMLNNKDATIEELKNLHIKIDSKYSNSINDLGKSCYNWNKDDGFIYDPIFMDKDSYIHNLKNMKGKLEEYYNNYSFIIRSMIPQPSILINNTNENYNYNKNNNTLDFKVLFEQINNMESLSSTETSEVLEKLEELENIFKSNMSKKSKWDKIKSILIWLADKSVDIAITFIPAISEILKKK